MGDGVFRSIPSALNFSTLLYRFICCSLFFTALTIGGCYSGQDKQIAVREGVKDDRGGKQVDEADQNCSYFYFLWGKSAELQENFEEAREAYEKALICDPGREHIRKRLVGVLIQMGREEQALVHLKEMTAKGQDNIDNLFLLARLYAKMDRYQKAEATYKTILDIEPENQRALLFLGTLYAQNGNFEKGRKILEKLVEVNQESFMGYNYLAKLYRELNLTSKAATAYNRALEINWSKELAWEAVKFYEGQAMYEEAADIYKRFLEEDSANLKLRGRLVKIYLHMDKVDEAMEALRDMKAYMVDTLQLDITIGRFLLEEQEYDEAINHFRQMLEEDRKSEAIRGFLALAYHEAGNDEKAEEVLSEIPPTSAAYEDAVVLLIRIYQDENNADKAISLLKKAISSEESRRPSFYTILAELYHEKGNSEAGVEIYQEGINHYPDDIEILYNYAVFLDRIGRVDKALKKMEQVLNIDPDDPQALNYVGYTWADQGRNLDKALSYIEKAVAARPESGFILDSLGWVYYKRSEYEKAVVELEKAVQLEPDDPTINEHLADAYIKTGHPEKAASAYRKALELYNKTEKKAVIKEKLEELNLK